MDELTKGIVKDNVITLGTVTYVGGGYSTRKFSVQPTMMYSGVRISVPDSTERQTKHFIIDVDWCKHNIHVGPDHLMYDIIEKALCDQIGPKILIRNVMYILQANLPNETFIDMVLDEMVHIHVKAVDIGIRAAKKEIIQKLGLDD